jgi:hypothetical protein
MTSKQNAQQIAEWGGACLASEWTTGTGNWICKRPIPIWCAEYERYEVLDKTRGETKREVARLLKAHPRAQKFIVLENRRAFNAWQKGQTANEK